MNASRVAARLLAPVAGAAVGFFGALAAIFGDAGSSERVNTILGVSFVYGLIAFACGLLERGRWTIALYVWLPGFALICAYLLLGEWSTWPWALFVLGLTFGTSVAGARLGVTVADHSARRRRS